MMGAVYWSLGSLTFANTVTSTDVAAIVEAELQTLANSNPSTVSKTHRTTDSPTLVYSDV